MDSWSRLTSHQNLLTAYQRARWAVENFEGLYDVDEIAAWEADLDTHLDRVGSLLRKPPIAIPCRLSPIPKADGKARAYYSIPLEYQTGWLAILQVLGPMLDRRMPNWSFGYRLYRPRLRDSEGRWFWDKHPISGREFYLGFGQSYKPFRRYTNLTLYRLLGNIAADDPIEADIRRNEEQLRDPHLMPGPGKKLNIDLRERRFPYLANGWGNKATGRAWYAQIDLKKFFPSIKCSTLLDRLMEELSGLPESDQRESWKSLLRSWLHFEEDARGFTSEALETLAEERVTSGGLPVGLIASGFLANIYMLSVDRAVERALLTRTFRGHVAVLRYVDDHLILALDSNLLCRWLSKHLRLLEEHRLRVSPDKFHPGALREFGRRFDSTRKGEESAKLSEAFIDWLGRGGPVHDAPQSSADGRPFERTSADLAHDWEGEGSVTHLDRKTFVSTTLQRMSRRADEMPELLDDEEVDSRIVDLCDLAQAEEEGEVRADTRHAFAAAQLGRTPLWVPAGILNCSRLHRELSQLEDEIERTKKVAPNDSVGLKSREARLVHTRERLDHAAKDFTETVERRGQAVGRQVLAALLAAPHKHRLLGRWVQVAANALELLPKRSGAGTGVEEASDEISQKMRALAELLSGKDPENDAYRWGLASGEFATLAWIPTTDEALTRI